jgi:hypothetical protein
VQDASAADLLLASTASLAGSILPLSEAGTATAAGRSVRTHVRTLLSIAEEPVAGDSPSGQSPRSSGAHPARPAWQADGGDAPAGARLESPGARLMHARW